MDIADNFVFGDLSGIDLKDCEEIIISSMDKQKPTNELKTTTLISTSNLKPKELSFNNFNNNSPEPNKIFTVKQAAALLQIRTETILRKIYAGELKAFKVGRIWRIKQSQIDDYLSKNISQFEQSLE